MVFSITSFKTAMKGASALTKINCIEDLQLNKQHTHLVEI